MGRTYRNTKEDPRERKRDRKAVDRKARIRESMESDDPIKPRRDESDLAFIRWLLHATPTE